MSEGPAQKKTPDIGGRVPSKPPWLRVRVGASSRIEPVSKLLRRLSLNTVCEEARCPNIHECYGAGTATFLIMGDTCTRRCGFCAVKSGKPEELDPEEPKRVAEAVKVLNLKYVVITSVDRDDLPDGGASHFASTICAIRSALPSCTIEVLTPDFRGKESSIESVLKARPNVFGHNIETVKRLFPLVRPQAKYARSLYVLRYAKESQKQHGARIKSGLMLGLGEREEEIEETLKDLVEAGCQIVTIGQYLAPSCSHFPVKRFVEPSEFKKWEQRGKELGIAVTYAGPLVRSSYHAEKQASLLEKKGPA